MSVYSNCTVCGSEGFNTRTHGGDICDECLDYWTRGEEECEECGGQGFVMPGDNCPDCSGSGVEKGLPGYIAHKVDNNYELTQRERQLVKKYEYSAEGEIMTVELIPKSDIFEIGVANGTWFTMVNTSEIKELISEQKFNDPINVDAETALKCAEALENWNPPEGWFSKDKESVGKEMLLEFFKFCGGFETR